LLTTCRVAQLGSLGPLRNVRTSTTRRGRNVVLHQSGRDIRATRVTTLQRRCFRSTAGGQQLRADEAEKLTASISRPRHPNDRTKYRRSGFSALGPGWVKTPPGMHAPGILRPVARRRAPELRHASFRRALRSDQIRSSFRTTQAISRLLQVQQRQDAATALSLALPRKWPPRPAGIPQAAA
jgi:hypothetical protein